MQKPEIWKLVVAQLISSKKDLTLSDWRSYITQYLVPEIKLESNRFFGGIDDQESRYPGLDYANPAHRLRLGSFHHHAGLFKAFDKLRLTEHEIYILCKWHGTKRAKDEHERNRQTRVIDTTWAGVHPYQLSEPTVTVPRDNGNIVDSSGARPRPDDSVLQGEDDDMADSEDEESYNMDEDEDLSDEESEDELQQSIGVELNQRLVAGAEANAEARARGEQVITDAEWEQWMKEAAERGETLGTFPSGSTSAMIDQTSLPWRPEIPNILGVNIGLPNAASQAQPATTQPSASPEHQPSVSLLQTVLSQPEVETTTAGPSSLVQGH